MALPKAHHIETLSEFNSLKFSYDSTNTHYFTGGTDTVVEGTPDILYTDIAYIKPLSAIYTHAKIYPCPILEYDSVPTANSTNLVNSGNIKNAIDAACTPQKLGNGYASCATAAATAAKTATLSGYNLENNGLVVVYFQYDVPANATLNINSRGAKQIHFGSSRIAANVIKAGDKCLFIYNGNYMLIAIDRWGKELQEKVSGINISETDFEALSDYEQGKLYFVYDNNS